MAKTDRQFFCVLLKVVRELLTLHKSLLNFPVPRVVAVRSFRRQGNAAFSS